VIFVESFLLNKWRELYIEPSFWWWKEVC